MGTDGTSELIALGDSIYQRHVGSKPATNMYSSQDRSSLYSSRGQSPASAKQNGIVPERGYNKISTRLANGNSAGARPSRKLPFSNGASIEDPSYLDLPSYSGYAGDHSRDSTAEILKESGSIQRRMDLSDQAKPAKKSIGDSKRNKVSYFE